ncbi:MULTISPECIES: metallophosphoesterase [unclassified Clostridium]|uniref:metallophosphoesterase n=1 Tax=Clostridium TaxID=1485 RepID=UPI001C8C14F4|nr:MULTISPECIES: metallophosphoesterase [unclassified Clostridium]MBX9136830.1 serine/threonine protein phosphatase [Clostridium sp. K12(2020)]MBX9143640.1 serine/threonine protein phosphatase [Clostridium sp. K13]MDU2289600.1 metallophosphoesterase [Clostridium celatum]
MSEKELKDIYDNGFTLEFNNDSKIVLISDVHRGDGTYADSLLPNRNIYITALKYYLKNNYTYIEVGDGDELWKNKNFNEIAYFYDDIYKLFNKFKSKNDIYCIYGNHDFIKKQKNFIKKQEKSLRKIGANYGKEFIKFINNNQYYAGINLLYKPLEEKILVTHGHQIDFCNNEIWKVNEFLVRYIWRFLNGVAGFKDPTRSAKSKTKRSRVDIKLQNWARDNCTMIICGHTHNSRFPDLYDPPYFNDGCCVYPVSITAIEIEKGKIKLVKWIIDAQDTGSLWVTRKIIAGPADISAYLQYAKEERVRRNK